MTTPASATSARLSMRAQMAGFLVLMAFFLLLTVLTVGTDDGSTVAHWCAQHDEAVTAAALEMHDRPGTSTWSATKGQACLGLYKER